jgi:hypothetical protein
MVLGLVLLEGSGAAFAPLSSTGLGGDERLQLCASNAPCQRVCTRLASSPLLALRSQMDRNELSAVQRMTKGYDKLCKNCPTRLQPRVDTLTEVVSGSRFCFRLTLLLSRATLFEEASSSCPSCCGCWCSCQT